jgi:hypothetical protein
VICFVKDHVAKFAFVHKFTALWALIEVFFFCVAQCFKISRIHCLIFPPVVHHPLQGFYNLSSRGVGLKDALCESHVESYRACCPNRPDWKEKSTQAGGDVLTECSHHDGTTEERAAAL